MKDVSSIIKELTGVNNNTKKIDFNNENFLVYSYTCLDQSSWNEDSENESIKNEFIKYKNILQANTQIAEIEDSNERQQLYDNKYVRYGFSNKGTVLLTSDINHLTYTKIAQKYKSEYLYTYILTLYKKLLLKKLNYQFNKETEFKIVEKDFLDFTKQLWIQEITSDDLGKKMIKNWENILETDEMFMKLKNEYDVLYKKYNVETSQKNNKVILAVIGVVIAVNIISIIITLLK